MHTFKHTFALLNLAAIATIPLLFVNTSPSHAGNIATLAHFGGSEPNGGLLVHTFGDIYGTTNSGGFYGKGTLFKIAADTGVFTTLINFQGTNGSNPAGGLIEDTNGNIYGTTANGGAHDRGTVFKYNRSLSTLTTLASFDSTTGRGPEGTLTADVSGNIYGTTFDGGTNNAGTVFKLGNNGLSTLASLEGNVADRVAGLTPDNFGNLYGTTSNGGDAHRGTIFKVNIATSTMTTIANFHGNDGSKPSSGLVKDISGDFYGVTSEGGAAGNGTLFKLDRNSNAVTTLASFGGLLAPNGSLVADFFGNIYGTCLSDAYEDDGNGGVFRYTAGTNSLNTIAKFDGPNGSFPLGGLAADRDGYLYGTTIFGGAQDGGVAFRVGSPASGTTLRNTYYISVSGPLIGDVNLDGIVDQLDLNLVNQHWQQTDVGLALGDANEDGVVDQLDLNLVNSHWQQTSASGNSAIAVPEPTAIALFGPAATLLARRGRRRQTFRVRAREPYSPTSDSPTVRRGGPYADHVITRTAEKVVMNPTRPG